MVMCIYAVCFDRGPGFFYLWRESFYFNSFQPASSRLCFSVSAREGVRACVCVCVCVLHLGGEEETLCADKLPMEYSDSTVAPEASHGPGGRAWGREGSSVIEGREGGWGGQHGERVCRGCLNSSKSRGSAACVWCHALRGLRWARGGGGGRGRLMKAEGTSSLNVCVCVCVCVSTCCG